MGDNECCRSTGTFKNIGQYSSCHYFVTKGVFSVLFCQEKSTEPFNWGKIPASAGMTFLGGC